MDGTDADVSVDTVNLHALMDIHVRIAEIRHEIDLLENPLLRQGLLRKQRETISNTNAKPEKWIVFEHGKVDDCLLFLNQVKQHIPNEDIKYAPTLRFLLDSVAFIDTVLLNRCRHVIHNEGALQAGGTLKGLFHRNDTVLVSKNEKVMLDFAGEKVLLENLTIDASDAQCGILVRQGSVTLNNCKLTGTYDNVFTKVKG